MGVAGQHVIPFGKDYMVSFLMISPLDPKATAENEIMTRVFNSFHMVGEPPNIAPRLPASGEPRSFTCKEPLPEFTLGRDSNPSDEQLAKLCACVWSKLPEGGWERRVSAQIRKGEDPGWRGQGFIPRFGAAIDACGGRSL